MPYAPDHAPRGDIRFGEFVAIVALMMAVTAFGIDIMLAALPDIAATYQVSTANDRQLVITVYMVGFAAGQLLYGPLSDRFGRKPMLAIGLVLFATGSLLAALAPSFGSLLAARALQGFGASGPRIMAVAVVRDRFAGRDMARVMSFAMMVFIIVPVLAPGLGDLIVRLGEWRWVFGALFLAAVGLLGWITLRLPETRAKADRLPLSVRAVAAAFAKVVTTRRSIGYTVATGFLFGGLLAYVGSSQQVFADVYGLGDWFPLVFGAIAVVMAGASLVNARLVGTLGMRRLSHYALIGHVAVGLIAAAAGFPEHPPLIAFCLFCAVVFFCFGLVAPNFNALAMEPLGHVAGTASSFIGFYTTAAGALLGWFIGQSFDGTVRPLMIGFSLMGVLALVSVIVTEGGLFRRNEDTPAA